MWCDILLNNALLDTFSKTVFKLICLFYWKKNITGINIIICSPIPFAARILCQLPDHMQSPSNPISVAIKPSCNKNGFT